MIKAYYLCRKNKRYTANALAFEIDYEGELFQLWEEINSGACRAGKGTHFGILYDSLQKWNEHIREKKKPDEQELLSLQSSVNSYLGLLKHYQTYRLRKNMLLRKLSAYYLNHFYISGGYGKLVRKKRRVRKKKKRFLPVYDRPSWEEVVARRRVLAALDFGPGPG